MGEEATYVCEAGYKLEGGDNHNYTFSIKCLGNDTWDNPRPNCEGTPESYNISCSLEISVQILARLSETLTN